MSRSWITRMTRTASLLAPSTTFFAAAEEAGISRLYAGIHFQSGNLNGRALDAVLLQR